MARPHSTHLDKKCNYYNNNYYYRLIKSRSQNGQLPMAMESKSVTIIIIIIIIRADHRMVSIWSTNINKKKHQQLLSTHVWMIRTTSI